MRMVFRVLAVGLLAFLSLILATTAPRADEDPARALYKSVERMADPSASLFEDIADAHPDSPWGRRAAERAREIRAAQADATLAAGAPARADFIRACIAFQKNRLANRPDIDWAGGCACFAERVYPAGDFLVEGFHLVFIDDREAQRLWLMALTPEQGGIFEEFAMNDVVGQCF